MCLVEGGKKDEVKKKKIEKKGEGERWSHDGGMRY